MRDIILIDVEKPPEKTASGIYVAMAEDWKTLPPTGVVKAIGPEVVDRELVGKRVMFERYSSVVLEKDQRFCKEIHILAVLDDAKSE